jgi:hypothetical protein
LVSSKEQVWGSLESCAQVMLNGPPDVAPEETSKLLRAETKVKKRIALDRHAIKTAVCAKVGG